VVSSDDSGRIRQKKAKWITPALLLLVILGGAWGARALALRAAVGASVATVGAISEALPEPHRRPSDASRDLLFPLWPFDSSPLRVDPPKLEPAPGGALAEVQGTTTSPGKAQKKALPPSPQNARASVHEVLKWAELKLVPQGITREAAGGLPAGIELFGVSVLGIGLVDGDRLITVDGVSVLDRGQVVGAVLGARSRRAEAMTAGLVRRTAQGVETFSIVVEQPYPEHLPAQPQIGDEDPGEELHPEGAPSVP
jgi:hypothetical protein